MKIVNLDSYALNPGDLDWSPLEKLGQCKFYDRTPVDNDLEILKRIGDAQIVLTNKTPLNQNVLQAAPQIQYIGVMPQVIILLISLLLKRPGLQ